MTVHIAKNLADIRDLVSWIVNFNSGQTDQAFIGPSGNLNKHINRAINLAYAEEVSYAQKNSSREAFYKLATMTWTASAETMPIPTELQGNPIMAVKDITNEDPGVIVSFYDTLGPGSGLYTRDSLTWGWDPAPGETKTLQIVYLGSGTPMSNDGDEPDLIPEPHRALLAWSAAILLKEVADIDPPSSWLQRRNNMRLQLWKELSLGRPAVGGQGHIRFTSVDSDPTDDLGGIS